MWAEGPAAESSPASHRLRLVHPVQRRRLRSVLLDLIYQAARLVYHARRWCLVFGRENRGFDLWQRLYRRFCMG